MSAPEPLVRQAARVILVDDRDRVLLLRGSDPGRPDSGFWWITAGGGRDEGESAPAAARREVFEETGLALGELGPVVLSRAVDFEFEGQRIRQDEVFFLVRIRADVAALDTSGWNEIERRTLTELRWWTLEELATTSETIYPEGLLELLQDKGFGH